MLEHSEVFLVGFSYSLCKNICIQTVFSPFPALRVLLRLYSKFECFVANSLVFFFIFFFKSGKMFRFNFGLYKFTDHFLIWDKHSLDTKHFMLLPC